MENASQAVSSLSRKALWQQTNSKDKSVPGPWFKEN